MLGLYIHIPFCRQKCFYCDFFSVNYEEFLADKYIESVVKHAEAYGQGGQGDGDSDQSMVNTPVPLTTIYIGGGTPSVLSETQIKTLLSGIASNFNLSGLKEFTFEANPESLTENKLKILKNYGVNRLSLGLQSCNDKYLSLLGRVHNFETFKKVFALSRSAGFDNINIDLIYGFSGQTLNDFQNDLSEMLKFKSEHISLYPLAVEENTVFHKTGVKTNSDTQAEMYEKACEMLQKSGYVHYEISNWSLKGKESLHNSNYWRNYEYIALGAGASGYYNRIRYKNIPDIEKYCRHCEEETGQGNGGIDQRVVTTPVPLTRVKQPIAIEQEYISDDLYETESIMLGLRLLNDGVDIKKFTSNKNISILKNFLKDKILINDNGKIKLSERHIFISNTVISEFM
ncbi:MAG: radical SAM family heme chaperone HemW [Endomicrobia bacterium]|nr:radical SAM family heme chaperone HemW [Endomicrobiia bacterium]MCL2507232.1 radical SAM family heme chaperone HemW [Endomicrobiia bacterium]